MNRAQLQALADQINALTPAQRLRLAADAFDEKRPDLALMIAKPLIDELDLALRLKKIP
jgi:hypothetical protein